MQVQRYGNATFACEKVGMGGFEPPASRTLSECANQTALHPGRKQKYKIQEKVGHRFDFWCVIRSYAHLIYPSKLHRFVANQSWLLWLKVSRPSTIHAHLFISQKAYRWTTHPQKRI